MACIYRKEQWRRPQNFYVKVNSIGAHRQLDVNTSMKIPAPTKHAVLKRGQIVRDEDRQK